MDKLGVALIVMLCIAGILYSWIRRETKKIERTEQMGGFLEHTAFVFETEKVRLIPYLKSYECNDSILMQTVGELVECLESYTYPSGEKAWEAALMRHEMEFQVSGEVWQLWKKAGIGLFGRIRKENIALLKVYADKVKVCADKEKQAFLEQKKVFIPVGILGGMMLLIMLI